MKADILTGFLSENIKVYGTAKNSKPFSLPGKIIRRAYPFLIASSLTFSGCGQKQPAPGNDNGDKEPTFTEIYHEVVEQYKLTALKDKEPLPQEFVNTLIIQTDAPQLTDTNFNHCPENQENFWEIVKNGIEMTKKIQLSSHLNHNQIKEYQITAFKMLSQISRAKGTQDEVDLSDYNNLKAFLYFEKVLRYGSDYKEVLEKEDGIIDERCEAFGRYYKDGELLENRAAAYPGTERFARALYHNNDRFMLTYADSAQANAMSRDILREWLAAQEIKDKGLWYLTDVKEDDFANSLVYWYKQGEAVSISLGVDRRGDIDDGDFSPVGTILIHELQHLMQKRPASDEISKGGHKQNPPKNGRKSEILSELGPTLYSLALEDGIYKKLHGLPADAAADYGELQIGSRKIPLGEVALFFGKMLKKYPYKSVDKVVAEREVLNQFNQWGNGTCQAVLHRNGRGD